MSFTHGMNVQEVRDLGEFLKRQKQEIKTIIDQIESKVNSTTWEGNDARTFKNDWWPGHKQSLTSMGEALEGFGQSALNNAQEQEDISGR